MFVQITPQNQFTSSQPLFAIHVYGPYSRSNFLSVYHKSNALLLLDLRHLTTLQSPTLILFASRFHSGVTLFQLSNSSSHNSSLLLRLFVSQTRPYSPHKSAQGGLLFTFNPYNTMCCAPSARGLDRIKVQFYRRITCRGIEANLESQPKIPANPIPVLKKRSKRG